VVQVLDHRGERGGLARARRPGHEHEAARLVGKLADHVGQPHLVEPEPPNRSLRSTAEYEPRCRNSFTRNRPTPASEYAKSISPEVSSRSRRSGGTIASTIVVASSLPSGAWSSGSARPRRGSSAASRP